MIYPARLSTGSELRDNSIIQAQDAISKNSNYSKRFTIARDEFESLENCFDTSPTAL